MPHLKTWMVLAASFLLGGAAGTGVTLLRNQSLGYGAYLVKNSRTKAPEAVPYTGFSETTNPVRKTYKCIDYERGTVPDGCDAPF